MFGAFVSTWNFPNDWQAQVIYNFKNNKDKLLNINSGFWFNKKHNLIQYRFQYVKTLIVKLKQKLHTL